MLGIGEMALPSGALYFFTFVRWTRGRGLIYPFRTATVTLHQIQVVCPQKRGRSFKGVTCGCCYDSYWCFVRKDALFFLRRGCTRTRHAGRHFAALTSVWVCFLFFRYIAREGEVGLEYVYSSGLKRRGNHGERKQSIHGSDQF